MGKKTLIQVDTIKKTTIFPSPNDQPSKSVLAIGASEKCVQADPDLYRRYGVQNVLSLDLAVRTIFISLRETPPCIHTTRRTSIPVQRVHLMRVHYCNELGIPAAIHLYPVEQ